MTASDCDRPEEEGLSTTRLLELAQGGDRAALDDLLAQVMPLIERCVRREQGALIRSKYETVDCAQDVAIDLIRYLPRVQVNNRRTFHALLYRMVQSSLHNKYDFLTAHRRAITREKPLQAGTVLILDPPDPNAPTPSMVMAKEERRSWIRFALALLKPEEQELIFRHQFDDESFIEIGEALGTSPDAVRMRFNRALTRLNSMVGKLRQGQASELFPPLPE